MDVDERLARSREVEQRVAARRHLAEPAADREHEIGVGQTSREPLVHGDAEHADVARRAVVDEVLAAERARDRELVRLAERLHVAARLRRPAALAHDDERSLGGGEQLAQPLEIPGRGLDARGLDANSVGDVRLLGEHVLGQREHDRARPPGQRERERLGHRLGDVARRCRPPTRPSRSPPNDLGVVELLPRLAAAERARHLPDEEDHRRRVLLRRVHADRRLRRARARA